MNHNNSRHALLQESLMFLQSELFAQVQQSGIFTDSKMFADAIAKAPIVDILADYKKLKQANSNFDLMGFVVENFALPKQSELMANERQVDINQQIETIWQVLEQPADQWQRSSLLPLNHSYVVPGGRFREIYYWDSYFSALGLISSNRISLVQAMLENFVELQTTYGVIPNGNRSYYLSRSQPPILGLLVELLLPYQLDKTLFLAKYLPAIEAEYLFWMQGRSQLNELQTTYRRVVSMPNGSVLNRYWDESTTPRPESYREDIELFEQSSLTNSECFYRNIRAACESGWDFSSRWLTNEADLTSVCTTQIVPIDLNCLLYKQEMLLSRYYEVLANQAKSIEYHQLASQRHQAIQHYFWSESEQYYMDYHLETHSHTAVKSLAGVLPLFVELASTQQAAKVADMLKLRFLKAGGLLTTLVSSKQQWDAPNGWAPLQWFSVQGLLHYQHNTLAGEIIDRWQGSVEQFFQQTGKLMEKYNVCTLDAIAEGGEYDVQEGFGWTNGVYQAFAQMI